MARFTLMVVCVAVLAGCDRQPATPTIHAGATTLPASRTIIVMAAASLAQPFKTMGHEYELANARATVALNFNGSDQLRAQLEAGAPADVFASANAAEMDVAAAKGLVVRDTVQTFAKNRLVVITPTPASPSHVAALADLAKPGVKIITANQNVPIYKYTVQMLDAMERDPAYGAGFKQKVLANVVSYEENVKTVVAKIRLGAGDAGVVYVSDAKSELASLATLEVPDAFNPIAEYKIAVASKAPQSADARRFVDTVLSPEGQKTLQDAGFMPAKP